MIERIVLANMDKEIRSIISKNMQDVDVLYENEDDLVEILGINSLAIVKIVADIEEYYDICFDLDDLVREKKFTVQLFVNMVKSALLIKGN